MIRSVLFLAAALFPLHAEWVASAYLGGASHEDSSLYVRQPGLGTGVRFRDLQYRSRSFDSPLYYGVRGGYFFNRWFGVDAELVHVKAYARTLQASDASGEVEGRPVAGRLAPATVLERFDLSHGVNLLLANAVVRHDFMRPPGRSRGPITLSVRAGGGQSIPHVESAFRGVVKEQYELGGLALQIGGGVELQIWRDLAAIIEYKYSRSRENVSVAFGAAEALLKTHHGVFGLAWHF